jgi:hypothetical protein
MEAVLGHVVVAGGSRIFDMLPGCQTTAKPHGRMPAPQLLVLNLSALLYERRLGGQLEVVC